ncbi:MAG: hypothetical protein NC311_02345 [Muribaculaceae bacterium]|nr:hypothetical protein [Muribaculaceae bacterium]
MKTHQTLLISITLLFANNAHADDFLVACLPRNSSCSHCSTSYYCDSGYYGTATSASTGCTKCPANTTCAGGNNSTFVCNSGYYKTDTGCVKCPANATCDGTSRRITCDKSYYPYPNKTESTSCIRCPAPGINGAANDYADITSCFLYHQGNGTYYYDQSGNFDVESHCYWSLTETPTYPVLGMH